MKIMLNNSIKAYGEPNDKMATNTKFKEPKRISRNFDEIQLHANKEPVQSDKFVNELSRRLSAEIQKPTPSYKIDELKTQIEAGTYQIDIDGIIKKIMLT